MATQLFKKHKDGGMEEAWVEAERVRAMVLNGWFFSVEDIKNAEIHVPEIKAPTEEEADTNKTGKLSVEEIREAAKKAGIEEWKTARIKTLKRLLGYGKG